MPIKRSCENISFSFKWGIFFFEYLGRRIEGENWFKFCGGKEGGIFFFSALWRWCGYDGGLSSSPPPPLAVGLVQAGGRSLWKERRKKKRRGGFFFQTEKGNGSASASVYRRRRGRVQAAPLNNSHIRTTMCSRCPK